MLDESKGDGIELTGSLLLAHPHLKDPNFVRSVVLMTSHEEDGSLGVVVNKAAGLVLSEVNPEFDKFGLGDVPLFIGGPVCRDQILMAGWKVAPGSNEFRLYFGLDPETAQQKREEDPNLELRAFRGYSGWEKGQLLSEIYDNAWVVSGVDGFALTKFAGDRLWRKVIMNINLELGLLSMAPEAPELN